MPVFLGYFLFIFLALYSLKKTEYVEQVQFVTTDRFSPTLHSFEVQHHTRTRVAQIHELHQILQGNKPINKQRAALGRNTAKKTG